jgi:hypothetical protein
VEVLRRTNGLADQLAADHHAVALDERAVGRSPKATCAMSGGDQRVDDPSRP